MFSCEFRNELLSTDKEWKRRRRVYECIEFLCSCDTRTKLAEKELQKKKERGWERGRERVKGMEGEGKLGRGWREEMMIKDIWIQFFWNTFIKNDHYKQIKSCKCRNFFLAFWDKDKERKKWTWIWTFFVFLDTFLLEKERTSRKRSNSTFRRKKEDEKVHIE